MTNKQMQEHLQGLGLKKTYFPFWESESRTILLTTRRPTSITDGRLQGGDIALGHGGVFRIWTPKARKAKATAAAHGLKVRLWNGEAELCVPSTLADTILPRFGAKIKRTPRPLTAAQRQALIAHSFKTSRDNTQVPASNAPQGGHEEVR